MHLNKKILSLILIFTCLCALPAQAYIDTKYFASFNYLQSGPWESDYSINPVMRFKNGAKELYYYHLRTGLLFHPRNWLDIGFYINFSQEKDLARNWDPDTSFEFVVDPKIMVEFFDTKKIKKKINEGIKAEEEVVLGTTSGATKEPVAMQMVRQGLLTAVDIISYGEIEFHDLDIGDLAKVHVIYQLTPRIEWQRDFGTLYVQDNIFYTLKYGDVYRNWATIGVIRPLNDVILDTYYTFESEIPQYHANPWEYAHVFGTNFLWDKRKP